MAPTTSYTDKTFSDVPKKAFAGVRCNSLTSSRLPTSTQTRRVAMLSVKPHRCCLKDTKPGTGFILCLWAFFILTLDTFRHEMKPHKSATCRTC